jgi:CrcB protein
MAWLAIGVAGALGALARYGLSGWVHRFAGPGFPAGTLVVNLAGCFVVGLLTELTRHVGWVSPEVRVWLGIGFLGAFTTFSTFGVETFRAAEAGDWHVAAWNIILNVAGGLALVLAGVVLARWLVQMRSGI